MSILKKSIAVLLSLIIFISTSATISTAAVVNNPFTDVKPSAWYSGAVAYCLAHEYVSGMTATEFRPNGNLTRAQFVTLLANIAKADLTEYKYVDSGFDDVRTSHWFHDVVTWAKDKGYVTGISETKFSPNAKVTREQMARIFYVYTEKNGYNVSDRTDLTVYTDAEKVSDWAKDQVSWAVAVGIINGMSENTLGPRGYATRAQAAQIIMVYTQIKFAIETDAFVAFTRQLEPFDPEYKPGVNFRINTITDKQTDDKIKREGLEFYHDTESDLLIFRYSYIDFDVTKSDEDVGERFAIYVWGSVYNGVKRLNFMIEDTEIEMYVHLNGEIVNGEYKYTSAYSGITEEGIASIAGMYINDVWALFDKETETVCGQNMISVLDDAPIYRPVDNSSVYERIYYSLIPDIGWSDDPYYMHLSYDDVYTDEHTQTENSYTSINEQVSVFVSLASDLMYIHYYEEKASGVDGEYNTENIDLVLMYNKDLTVGCQLYYGTNTASVTADIVLNNDGSYSIGSVTVNGSITEDEFISVAQAFIPRGFERIDESLKEKFDIRLSDIIK